MQLVNPPLVVAFPGRQGIDFCHHTDHPGYVSCLWLCSRHASESRRHEQHAAYVRAARLLCHLHAGSVEHGDRGAMDDALRPNVHVSPGSHLPILADAEGVEALPVVGLRVIRYDHAVGHDHPWSIPVRGEEAERMARIHHQRLLIGHFAEVFHGQPVLRPVLEDGPVAPVDNQFVRVLRHSGVEIVLYHEHYSCGLERAMRVFVNRTGIHLVLRAEAVHVYPPIRLKLVGKLRGKHSVEFLGEIPQRIAQGQLLLSRCEYVLALWRMVDFSVVWHRFGQYVGYAGPYLCSKLFLVHNHYYH